VSKAPTYINSNKQKIERLNEDFDDLLINNAVTLHIISESRIKMITSIGRDRLFLSDAQPTFELLMKGHPRGRGDIRLDGGTWIYQLILTKSAYQP
jgi:hypothetical protein